MREADQHLDVSRSNVDYTLPDATELHLSVVDLVNAESWLVMSADLQLLRRTGQYMDGSTTLKYFRAKLPDGTSTYVMGTLDGNTLCLFRQPIHLLVPSSTLLLRGHDNLRRSQVTPLQHIKGKAI